MAADPLDRAATAERLTAIAAAGGLSDRALARALDLASESPRSAEWRAFLSRSLLFLGSALMLAGVIFFFAYNWSELGRFAKFALLELAIAGAAAGAWQFGRTAAGEASLAAAAVLVGPLLAVYGQTYQTGADAWELFAFWAVLILPWVALARMPTLWLLEIALWNVALPLFSQQRLEYHFEEERDPIWVTMAGLDGAAWFLAERLQRSTLSWPKPRWPIRVLAVAAFALASPGAIILVLGHSSDAAPWLGAALMAGLAAAAYLLSKRPERRDLFILATAGTAVLTVLGCAVGRVVFSVTNDFGGVLLMALVVLGEVGALVTWLRKMGSAEVDEA
ncbi:MAG TPA: DUF2157 domain-containing protein [Myxococcaceae bacterium]|jgi:uncharacterized membrane protein